MYEEINVTGNETYDELLEQAEQLSIPVSELIREIDYVIHLSD